MTAADPAPDVPPGLDRRTIAIVVAGNLFPLFSVLVLGWSATEILLLYWCESLIAGAFALFRITGAKGAAPRKTTTPGTAPLRAASAPILAAFFVLHFGVISLSQGLFIADAVAPVSAAAGAGSTGDFATLARLWNLISGDNALLVSLVGLVAVQAHLLLRWRLSGAWRTAQPAHEMIRPYGRTLVLHLMTILGGLSLVGLSVSASAVALLCAVKIAIELAVLWRWSSLDPVADI